jgi:threonine/homoserine/homoserine lactone efflux protein
LTSQAPNAAYLEKRPSEGAALASRTWSILVCVTQNAAGEHAADAGLTRDRKARSRSTGGGFPTTIAGGAAGHSAMLETYLVTLAGLALGQITPGPNLLAVAGAALGQGRRAAFFTALGVATAIFVWATVTAFGLASLLALYPGLLTGLKLVGGSYLLFLGFRSLRAALGGGDAAVRAEAGAWTPFAAWRRGLLVNLTNPKSALLWAAIATYLFGAGLSASQVVGFAPLGFASALLVYGGYGALFSTGLAKRAYTRFARWFEALFGLAFGAFGARLVTDGVREVAR